jgi:exodeoxyribonuclease-3
MKIITWNVNGLRAVLNKGHWDWILEQNADLICLQEVKAKEEQLTPEQLLVFKSDYAVYWHAASRPGYSGVITLAKEPVMQVEYEIGNQHFDVEGRIICTRHPEFLLYNIYFPNGKRDQTRLTYKLEFYQELLSIFDALHASGEMIVVCGDSNTAHRSIDLRNPKQNETVSGFLPEERAWLDEYFEHGFADAFRELYPDTVKYTWWTYRVNARERDIGWRLDYFFVSKYLMARVKDVVIHNEVMGSDHCPVTLILV